MAITSYSNTSFIEEQFSKFILENLHDVNLPDTFYRDVTDFGSGSTLHIKTVGIATLQEVEEDTPLIYNPIESGEVTLQITDYVGDAWFITDVMRQDGSQVDQLLAARAMEATRAFADYFETRFLQVAHDGQTPADPNSINGFAHRFLATGGNQQMAENDLITMRLAFDKAFVPLAGRVAFVDPVVGATFSKLITLTPAVEHSRNSIFQRLLENGFANNHQFMMSLHGWDLWITNRLPDIAAGTSVDGTASVTNAGKACIFMNILDDNTKPVMVAMRQPVKTESERNKDRQRDEFITTHRYAMGVQRVDTLGVIVIDATATE